MIRFARQPPLSIFTVGHSNRTSDEFLDLLRAHDIEQLIDVRHYPRSRHHPHFNRDALARFLRNRRIGYRHMEALGGRRRALPDSPNAGWHNTAFRGFADHMQTPDFQEALDQLIRLAGRKRTAIMCAEAVPWRCHRWLLSDALVARNVSVLHILGPKSLRPHTLTPMARLHGLELTYPSDAPAAAR